MKGMLSAFSGQLFSVEEQFFSIKRKKIPIIKQIFGAHILSKEKERPFFFKGHLNKFQKNKLCVEA